MFAFHTDARRRALACLSIAALGALMAVPVTAESSSAATPKYFGQKATIVGTNGDDVIKGTPKADVIVAKRGMWYRPREHRGEAGRRDHRCT